MTYEAWRIGYQDSEQAARAAFDTACEMAENLRALTQARDELLAALERFANYPGSTCEADYAIARKAIAACSNVGIPLVEQNQQVAESKAIVAESVRKGADYLKQLKADAARYRWFRRNDREEIDEFMTNEGALDIVFVCDGQGSASKICEAELDAAIDKKIKAEKGGA